jgi:hypothetical protein
MGSSVNYPKDHATLAAQSVFTSAARGAEFEPATIKRPFFQMVAAEDAEWLEFDAQAKFEVAR